jgi:hypothetical protein
MSQLGGGVWCTSVYLGVLPGERDHGYGRELRRAVRPGPPGTGRKGCLAKRCSSMYQRWYPMKERDFV